MSDWSLSFVHSVGKNSTSSLKSQVSSLKSKSQSSTSTSLRKSTTNKTRMSKRTIDSVEETVHSEVQEKSDSKKQEVEAVQNDEESDDDFGPELPPAADAAASVQKKRVLAHEKLFVDQLPSSDMYEQSYMHRDTASHVIVTSSEFVITTSVDGHLKFWKKSDKGIQFVKHYRAHLGAIVGISTSADGALLATVSVDKTMKVFDIINFDMINMINFDYSPRCVAWVQKKGQSQALVAVSDQDSPSIKIYDGRGDGTVVHLIEKLHSAPVATMKYNPVHNCVVSADRSGMMEYWIPDDTFELPKSVNFKYKSETDLYEFKKSKTFPNSLTFSQDFSQFATLSVGDRQVRIFRFKTGKLLRKYDESLRTVTEMQQTGSAIAKLDDMEFGRRLAVEREMEKSGGGENMSAVFDESGNFLIYPSILGIKVVNLVTNKVVRLLGRNEAQRYTNLALYQGAPLSKVALSLAQAASDNPLVKENNERDPTLFCTAYKRNRFFMFTQREPDNNVSHKGDRDVFNEKPTREEQTVAAASQESKQLQGATAILRTTLGDIHIRLFPAFAPKAVENFVTHSRNGYYNNLIFHRVIKGFMLQTGCPFGDGTGGDSIWGHDFEDEFHKDVKHDRPYTVSMANAGPGTNAAQFFLTVAPTPWLDNKHTIFGRVTAGMDVVHVIENVRTDKKTDKPFDDVSIINIEVR